MILIESKHVGIINNLIKNKIVAWADILYYDLIRANILFEGNLTTLYHHRWYGIAQSFNFHDWSLITEFSVLEEQKICEKQPYIMFNVYQG